MSDRLKVRKADGIKMLRDAKGYPYPDGEFSIINSVYVRRRIKAKDLILIDDNKKEE